MESSDEKSSENFDSIDDIYRDKIATVDAESGKRIWVYPKKPKGRFYNYRKYLSYVMLIVLIVLPFMKYNGKPLFLLNVLENKFILFGVYYATQDFHLFVMAMLVMLVFIILFTVVFGRLFCGWICPQTIFMEMVFRRIEYWVEGDANAQKKLNKLPWNAEKIRKKTIKQVLFILVSIIITHIFLSYIIGVDGIKAILTDPINEHFGGFMAMLLFTIVFYGVFSVLREQVCTTICPYGRLQGVMLDSNSLAVAYDFVRGEPRGKVKKTKKSKLETVMLNASGNIVSENQNEPKPQEKGDCIDCGLCVAVCPTGIDIRNGTQLECINCTACMDACDGIMEKVNKPKGLIRIDSYNAIVEGQRKIWTPRVMAYSAVLIVLVSIASFLFLGRSDVETLILRTPGMLFQEQEDNYISNLYNYQLINKTDKVFEIQFVAGNIESAVIELVGNTPRTKENAVSEGALFIKIPKKDLTDRKTNVKILVYGDGELIDETKTTFLGPVQ